MSIQFRWRRSVLLQYPADNDRTYKSTENPPGNWTMSSIPDESLILQRATASFSPNDDTSNPGRYPTIQPRPKTPLQDSYAAKPFPAYLPSYVDSQLSPQNSAFFTKRSPSHATLPSFRQAIHMDPPGWNPDPSRSCQEQEQAAETSSRVSNPQDRAE